MNDVDPNREQAMRMQKHVEDRAHQMGAQMFGAFALPWPRKPLGKHGGQGKGAKAGPKAVSRTSRGRSRKGPFPGW